jgi:hypothetical protein
MNTKFLLGSSALVLGAAGVAGTFLPQELLTALHLPAAGVPVLLIQLHAAILLAFGIANWMAKGSLMGGIYNRPLALGNLIHFAIGTITLCKFAASSHPPFIIVAAAIYVAFAIGFGLVVFRSPAPVPAES